MIANWPNDYLITTLLLIVVGALLGLFITSTFNLIIKRNKKLALTAIHSKGDLFFALFRKLFVSDVWYETLLFLTAITVHMIRIIFFFAGGVLFFSLASQDFSLYVKIAILFGFIVTLLLLLMSITEIAPRLWVQKNNKTAYLITKTITSYLMCTTLPLSYILFHIMRLYSPKQGVVSLADILYTSKERLSDYIQDGVSSGVLSEHEKKLLVSVLQFKERVAREVMVPRVNLFCLPAETPIQEAALLLAQEGYSRVPIYQQSIDKIIGILMFKDLLKIYMESIKNQKIQKISEPVVSLVKKALYVPETKNISYLLQEFRKKQVHIAIVVDEYGGTSGLVTIEDILEEIVGDISDEYDEEQPLYVPCGENSWLVDAKMHLGDLEEQLDIQIPQGEEYDTLAGYVFFRLGTIPEIGTTIHHDDFDLEIVSSDARCVEKVKITQRQSPYVSDEQ